MNITEAIENVLARQSKETPEDTLMNLCDYFESYSYSDVNNVMDAVCFYLQNSGDSPEKKNAVRRELQTVMRNASLSQWYSGSIGTVAVALEEMRTNIRNN